MNDTIYTENKENATQTSIAIAMAKETATGKELGRLYNITTDGFLLITTEKMSTCCNYGIIMSLPFMVSETQSIELEAVCLSCQLGDEYEENYAVNFKIQQISEQDMVTLKYFIRDF